MKLFLTTLVGIILFFNAAIAFAQKNFHSTIGWCGCLIFFIWLVVEIRKEKIIISFEFEDKKSPQP